MILALLAMIVSSCSGGGDKLSSNDPSVATGDNVEIPGIESESTCTRALKGEIVQMPDGEFEVCQTAASYVEAAGGGGLAVQSSAAFALSGYGLDQTAGPTSLNHPSSGASDGTHLVIADRFNNRVLIFNSLPTGPSIPDVVLGQPNFTDTTPGSTLADMNWPGAVEITGDGKLLVADTENGRILVYSKIPTTNGASADFALDLEALTGEKDAWPWGVWSDGGSLVVTDTRKGNVLVWNSFPLTADVKPSSVTNPDGVGTPRNITSDGSNFLIGDENGSQKNCWGMEPQNKMRQSHVWINRLPIGNPDGCVWDWYQGDTIDGGVIALAAGGRDAHFWPEFPVNEATAAMRVTTGSQQQSSPMPQPSQTGQPAEPGVANEQGQPLPPLEPGQQVDPMQPQPQNPPNEGVQPNAAQSGETGHSYLGGDGGDVVVAGSMIYFVEYNGNRVTAWNSMPDVLTGKTPDFSVFDENPELSTLLRDGFIQNPVLVNTGSGLVASSDYDRRMYVWTKHPGADAARADYIYLTGFPAWDNSYAAGTLVLAGQRSVAIWRNFSPGNLPDEVLTNRIGSVDVDDLRGVAFDGNFLAIADRDSVSVFEGIPSAEQPPLRQYQIQGPGRLDMREGVLSIAPREGADIYIVDVSRVDQPRKLDVKVNLPMQTRFLEIGYAIADTSFHRVQIWSNVERVIGGAKPDVILGGSIGERPQTTSDRFYFPASIEEFDGNLYVGEFKFSNRILVFK